MSRRRLGAVTAGCIVVANTIGTGIFATTGFLAAYLPSPDWILSCWALGGLVALSGALCYAELATRLPHGGGEYLYLSRLLHPTLGFVCGWTSLVAGFSAPIAAAALAFVAYSLPATDPGGGFPAAAWHAKAVAVGVILVFTGIHCFGVQHGARLQNAMTILKIVLIAGLAAAGLRAAGTGPAFPPETAGCNGGPLAVGTAMMLVMFSYSGWNAAVYIAGEVRDPERTLPRALIGGTLVVVVLYLALNLFIVRSVPHQQLVGSTTATEMAVARIFGSGPSRLLRGLVSLALLSSLSAFVMVGPRVYQAMARDGLFFGFAARVDPRSGVPVRSIVFQSALAVIMVAAGGLEPLLVLLGFSLGLFPPLAVLGLFVARRRGLGDDRVVPVPGYPWVPAFFLLTSLAMLVVAFANRPLESTISLAIVGLGWPVCTVWRSRRRGWKDPSVRVVAKRRPAGRRLDGI